MGRFLLGCVFKKNKQFAMNFISLLHSNALGLLEGCNYSVLSQYGTVKSGTSGSCVTLDK